MTDQPADVSESIVVDAPPHAVYDAVSSIKRMREWSPDVIGSWMRGPGGVGTRFVGFNRRGGFVWFTSAVVSRAERDREFAFTVSTFGMPAAEWRYTFEPSGAGTLLTEHWYDRRAGRSGAAVKALGLMFTGVRAEDRPTVNRTGMRATLEAIRDSFGGSRGAR